MADVRCGVYLPTYGAFSDPCDLIRLGELAATHGWDGLFLWDHIMIVVDGEPQPVTDCWPVLAALSISTRESGMQLGPLITPVARRGIGKLAHEVATLDRLSGGRVVLGVGLGIDWDYEPFGLPGSRAWRGARLDSGIEALRRLWTGTEQRQLGAVVLDGARVSPAPLQAPLPIWVAGRWPAASAGPLRRAAAQQGMFFVTHGWVPPDAVLSAADLARAVEQVTDHAGGRLPDDFVVCHGGCSTGDPAADGPALADYVDAGMTYWLESFHPTRHDVAAAEARIRLGPPQLGAS